MTKILSKYVKQVTWSAMSVRQIHKLFKDQVMKDSNFRILKITKCKSLQKFSDFIRDNKHMRKLLVRSSHLFFLTIELDDGEDFHLTNDFKGVFIDLFKESKSFLLELCYSSDKIVRYILQNNELDELCSEEDFGCFEMQSDKSLVEYDLPITDDTLRNEKCWNPIAIRLLKTFDIECDEKFDKEILKKIVCQSKLQALRSYLDLPMVDDGHSLLQTFSTTRAVNYKYNEEEENEKNETLLFFAANGDFDVLNLLLRLGADAQVENDDSETASDYAKTYENLKLLLENDARFPYKFYETYNNLFKNVTESTAKNEIRKIYETREQFHAAIKAKDINGIKLFQKQFPSLKYAYTCTKEPNYSKAATTTALEVALSTEDYSDYTVYFLLLDAGFCLNDEELFCNITKVNKNTVNALTLSNLRKDHPSHVTFLMAMTKIYGVNKNRIGEYMEQMHRIYKELDQRLSLRNLLRLLQYSKSLIISVDFRNRKINAVDLNGMCKGMDGVTYHELGRIYVSAGGKTNDEIAGILIHELTHYALHIVFDNGCRPYYKSDKANESKFGEIIKEIKGRKDNHVVVKNVFSAYAEASRPKELIVTVTHMIALKVGERQLQEQYADLYKYFTSVMTIINQLIDYPEEFLIKREVQQLNEFLGHSKEIANWNVHLCNSKVSTEMFSGKDIHLVVCDTPKLFLADFYNSIAKPKLICSPSGSDDNGPGSLKHCYILASIEDFKCSSKNAYIERIWHLSSSIMLILNCDRFDKSDRTFAKQQSNYFKDSETSKNLVAFCRDESSLRQMFGTEYQIVRLEYEWNDIEQTSRTKLLETEIHFQGVHIQLNNLIDDTFSCIPMENLVNGEKIVIEASEVTVDNYDDDKFVDRSFTEYGNLDQVLSAINDESLSSFLLTGEAGTGKSTMLSRITIELKHKYPALWVTRINLHEHVDAFEDKIIINSDPVDIVFNYFVNTKALVQRSTFERKLFEKLFEESKVILLLDAVDEVAPKFVQQVSMLIQVWNKKIQLWITTRPHLKNDLESVLSDNVMKLEFDPFSRGDQLKCATKYWQKELNLFDAANESKLKVCAENIISVFTESINEFVWMPTVGAPLLTSMIAETYLKNVQEYVASGEEKFASFEYLDIFDLFKEFVSKKILIVSNEKGILVANEKAHNEIISHDTIAVFERFALKFIFKRRMNPNKYYVYHDAQFGDKTLMIDSHNIQRCGIVVFSSNGEPHFIHKTFAEFFIANFVVKSLRNASYADNDSDNKKFNIAMDILCKNIISSDQEHFTLIKFINGGMKYLWNEKNANETIYRASEYFSAMDEENVQFKYNGLEYVLRENAIVLLQFFLKTLTHYPNDREKRQQFLYDTSIFWQASEMCVRCTLLHLWQQTPIDIFKSNFLSKDVSVFSPLQLAFMKFPQSNIDVVTDITSFEELLEALSTKEVFDERLQEITVTKYKNSTLKLFVDIALDLRLRDDEISSLIYEYEKPDLNFDYNISEEHFADSIEMKWMAMEELGFPIDNWELLVHGTIFENVISLIFNEFNNKIVLQFYKWAKGKTNASLAFKSFVATTFTKNFWNCVSEDGAQQIFDFVRSEVNLMDILLNPNIDNFNEIIEEYLFSTVRFIKNFPICWKYFTKDEFETLLLTRFGNDEGDKFISKIFNYNNGFILESVLMTIFPLTSTNEFVIKIAPEVNANMLSTALRVVLDYSRENELSIGRTIKCIENISSAEHIKAALQSLENGETLFHVAVQRRDLSKLKFVWHLAKRRLTDGELEDLLLVPGADNFTIIQNKELKGFLDHPPSILNTNCATAAFEFLPFQFGDKIPELAIRINERNVVKSTYIGRCTNSNVDKYELCKINPKVKEVETIGIGDNPGQKVAGKFEILVGKGLKWIRDNRKWSHDFFQFGEHYLVKNATEDVSLGHLLTFADKYYLVYDDNTLASSSDDDDDGGTGIFYCHRHKIRNDTLY